MENVKRTMDVIEKNSSIIRIDRDSLFFTDFVMKGNGNDIFSTLEKKGVLGGIKASRILNRADEKLLLFAATEVITESDLEKLKIALEGI
jgi:glycine cleavage system pyridoxal-binding protein P